MKQILKIDNVSKQYGKKTVLDEVSFSIDEGEIVGLVGPNGAGKTTLMKIVTGLTPQFDGNVYFLGENINQLKKPSTKRIGCVIESPGFYPNLTGYENLLFALHLSGVKDRKHLDEIIDVLQIRSFIHQKVKSYSLGMRQRLGVAQAVLSYPPLLILDEPTNGLDPEIVPQLRQLIKHLAESKKISVLISSHILSEIELMCQTVVFIQKGKVISIDRMDQPKQGERMFAIETRQMTELKNYLDSHSYPYSVVDANTVHLSYPVEDIEDLVSSIISNNILIRSIYEVKDTLEGKYLRTMGEGK